nr:MAG TPA: hypothetical protein [Bacteriophage sp.]
MHITLGKGLLDRLKDENYLLVEPPTITKILNYLYNENNYK